MAKPQGIMGGLAEVADALNVTPRRVNQLANEGLPRASRGTYDIVAALRWYVRHLQGVVRSRGVAGSSGDAHIDAQMAAAKLRSALADAEAKEIAVRRTRGELVDVNEAAALWDGAVDRLRTRMLASVQAGAVRWRAAATMTEAHAAVEAIIHAALAEAVTLADEIENEGEAAAAEADAAEARDPDTGAVAS